MTEAKGLAFNAVIMQWGPIPSSGGPHRDRYLELHGRESLGEAADEYAEALALLGARASGMPALPWPMIEHDEAVRREIQQEKREDWIKFVDSLNQPTLEAIESHIKRSVAAAMAALNYLEDHPLRETAHEAIHRAAFVKRGMFGCPIVLRDDQFWTDCPINLSHLRVGFSAGLVSDFECSICGRLVEDCDHRMGKPYPKLAARKANGKCSICGAATCGHTVGETFLVAAYANARNAEARDVSLVARPRYPQARIAEMVKDVPEGDDPQVRHAATHGSLNCDADLGPCKGLNDMRDWDIGTTTSPDEDLGRPT